MTGEITIRGNVLAIGGLREKTMAAYSAGVRTILIPADNLKDLDKIDPVVRENVTFIPCKKASEVLSNALVQDNAALFDSASVKSDLTFADAIPQTATTRTRADAKGSDK